MQLPHVGMHGVDLTTVSFQIMFVDKYIRRVPHSSTYNNMEHHGTYVPNELAQQSSSGDLQGGA